MQQMIMFIFAFCLHICRFVARAVLWKVLAWSASATLVLEHLGLVNVGEHHLDVLLPARSGPPRGRATRVAQQAHARRAGFVIYM